ncbi:MAG: glycosyltransferase [Ruthenibacterium sp.]
MKILYLAPTDSFSGGENVTLQIAVQMKRRGHKVAYCSPYGSIEDFVCEQGVPFIGLDRFSLLAVKRAIRAFKPDIVHAMDYRASFYASLLFPDTISHLHNNCLWLSKLCPNAVALWITAHRAKRCICVSQSIPDDFCLLNSTNKEKFLVLRNVISPEEVLKKSKSFICERTYDLGFCGRLTKQKDPFTFLEIVMRVKKAISNVHAVMIGDGDLRGQVEQMVRDLGLQGNVELVGFQKNPFPYITACKVMVMPSLWEGLPMAAIEAMTLGKPLVATPVSGLRDIVTDNCGGLGKTPVVLAEKVLRCLYASPEVYAHLCHMARQATQPYTDIDSYVENVEQIYIQ